MRCVDAHAALREFQASQAKLGDPPPTVLRELGFRITKMHGGREAMLELHKYLYTTKLQAYGYTSIIYINFRHRPASIPLWSMSALMREKRYGEAWKIFSEARKYTSFDSLGYECVMG